MAGDAPGGEQRHRARPGRGRRTAAGPADQTPMRAPRPSAVGRPARPRDGRGQGLGRRAAPRPRTARSSAASSASPVGSPATTRWVGRMVISVAARSKRSDEDGLVGRVLGARPAGAALVAVLEGRGVAMVAVGDDDGPGLGQGDESIDRAAIAARSGRARPRADGGRRHRRRRPRRAGGRHRASRIGAALAMRRAVEPDDRAEVGARRARAARGDPPSGRPSVRSCGRTPLSGPERLERRDGRRSLVWTPVHGRPGQAVGQLVDVERRRQVLAQGPVGAPRDEGRRGPPVAIVGPVAGLRRRQVEPARSCAGGGRRGGLQLRRDDVVRRADDVGRSPTAAGS